MKKKSFLPILLILVILVGCQKDLESPKENIAIKKDNVHEENVTEVLEKGEMDDTFKDNLNYQLNQEVMALPCDGGWKLSYPNLQSTMIDCTNINQQIKVIVMEHLHGQFGESPKFKAFDLKYTITYASNDRISVLYDGQVYVEGAAYSPRVMFSFTLDVTTGKEVLLKDMTAIDETFLNEFRIAWRNQTEGHLNDYLDNETDSSLMSMFEICDSAEGSICSFLIGNHEDEYQIGIAFPIAHAAGDYQIIYLYI